MSQTSTARQRAGRTGAQRVAMAVVVIVAGYVSDALNVDTAWALGAGVIAAYAISRGLAKAGSREGPFTLDLTDNNGQGANR